MAQNFCILAVNNCELLAAGLLRLGLGKSIFRVDLPIGQELEISEFSYISFDLEIQGAFIGQIGNLQVTWQDVPIAEIGIHAYGKQVVRLPIKFFEVISTFKLNLEFELTDRFYRENFDSFSPGNVALLSNFSAIAVKNEIGVRTQLVPAARGIAVELGLIDDYLQGATLDLLQKAIATALETRCGFSLVRLGDGEGRVLGYPDHFSDQEVLIQLLHYQFGPYSMQMVKLAQPHCWIASAMQFLRDMIVRSIKNADMLGVPPNTHFPTQSTHDHFGSLGYACAMIYGISLSRNLPPTSYVGTDVFQLAAAKGVILGDIIRLAPKVHLVGPWDLTQELNIATRRNDLHFIKVPGHHTWGGNRGIGQFPDLFHFVEARINALGYLGGHLFLVGAGLFGKHYCNLIKLQGGVALDVGSILDSWAKKGLPYAVQNEGIDIKSLR